MQDYTDEFVPHKKKSSAKPPKKAKHKHDFQHCIFGYYGTKLDQEHGFVPEREQCFGGYCTICGKIGKVDLGKWFKSGESYSPLFQNLFRTEYTDEAKRELNPETRTLPTFWLDDRWKQKFVELESE